MLIGVISDTHNRQAGIKVALELFRNARVEMIIHCGDWHTHEAMQLFAKLAADAAIPVRGVLGNNDKDAKDFLEMAKGLPGDFMVTEGVLELVLKDRKVAVYHGHHKPTKAALIDGQKHDIVLLGHSHKPAIVNEAATLVVNPGSTAFSIPRSKQWQASVALINVERKNVWMEFF